jgi:hypothetical protein
MTVYTAEAAKSPLSEPIEVLLSHE